MVCWNWTVHSLRGFGKQPWAPPTLSAPAMSTPLSVSPLPTDLSPVMRSSLPHLCKAFGLEFSFHFHTLGWLLLFEDPSWTHHMAWTIHWTDWRSVLIFHMSCDTFGYLSIHSTVETHVCQTLSWQISQVLWSSENICMKLSTKQERFPPQSVIANVHSSFILNSQKLETVFKKKWTDKQMVLYPYNGMILSNKNRIHYWCTQ